MLDPRARPKHATRRLFMTPSRRVAWTRVVLVAAGCLVTSPRAASTPEWLSSTEGPSPTVTSKSGVGTAQATAQAKVTADSLRTFCADQAGQGNPAQAQSAIDACVKQQKGELAKTYSISADCTVGRLQPLDGKSYVLDGLWDNSDIGGGRTRWKGPDGVVVGRDNASGGLALSQQWEVLCPGRVSATVLSKARSLAPATASGGGSAPTAPAEVCGGDPNCTEVSGFAMSVVEFRASLQGNYKVLTVTLRFRNKLGRPLVLGYVPGSGGATDDRGNRYVVRDGDTRGIGYVHNRNSVDDKFALAPGQTGDARFTLIWGGQQLFGSTFDLDVTVREIIPAGNGQSTLGPEYPLQIVGLVDGAGSRAPVAQASGATGSSSPAGSPSPSPPPSPTGGQASATTAPAQASPASPFGGLIPTGPATGGRCPSGGGACYDAGNFTVTVGQTVPVVSGNNHLVRFSVRVKNQTAQPLTLAYKAGSNRAVDDAGNAYGWGQSGTPDGSAQGIGMVDGARINPQFQIAPGATRDATLAVIRYNAGPRITARSFTLDTVFVELRAPAGGQQWQRGREVNIHLPGGGGVASLQGAPQQGQQPQGQNPANDQVQKASDLLKGLLGK